MANYNFKSTPLPIPPAEYSPEHFRQLIRVLELYFSRLDFYNTSTSIQLNTETVLNWSSAGNGMWSS